MFAAAFRKEWRNNSCKFGWALNIHIYFEYPWKTVVECDSGISEHLMVDLSVLFYRRENPIASVVQLQALYLITSKKLTIKPNCPVVIVEIASIKLEKQHVFGLYRLHSHPVWH